MPSWRSMISRAVRAGLSRRSFTYVNYPADAGRRLRDRSETERLLDQCFGVVGAGGVLGRLPVRLGDGLDHLVALDADATRGVDSDPDAVAARFEDRDDDVVADEHPLPRLARQYQHRPSLSAGRRVQPQHGQTEAVNGIRRRGE